jgi:hypothetical protein
MAYYTKVATFSDAVTNNSCNSLDTELSNIETGFATAEAAVGVNTAAIAVNTADIATNTGDIATNTSDIAALEAAVDSTAVGNTLGICKLVGYDFDATSAASSSGASWTACSVTVPANTATNGLKVTLSMQFDGTGVGNFDGFLPLRMKVGAAAAEDLSATGAGRDARFDIAAGAYGAGTHTHERTMYVSAATTSGLTTPFDKTAIVILYAGAAWNVGTAGNISNVSMTVEAV